MGHFKTQELANSSEGADLSCLNLPKIGIPADRGLGSFPGDLRSFCRQVYIDAVVDSGGLPVLIPIGIGEVQREQLYSLLDGVLLTGGEDVDPSFYGEPPHPKLGQTHIDRDKNEIWFVRRAFDDRKPILAICRGLQLMNVALDGTLIQDIPTQTNSEINHRMEGDARFNTVVHDIEIKSGTCLSGILGDSIVPVNSIHHQAINKVSDHLKVAALSPKDGIIEALESNTDTFAIGVQGHPESLYKEIQPIWHRLFKAFIEACRKKS